MIMIVIMIMTGWSACRAGDQGSVKSYDNDNDSVKSYDDHC